MNNQILSDIEKLIGSEKFNKLIKETRFTYERNKFFYWQEMIFKEIEEKLNIIIQNSEDYFNLFKGAKYSKLNQIYGSWILESIDMKQETTMKLIHGSPKQYVEFKLDNMYQAFQSGASCFEILSGTLSGEIDFWTGATKNVVTRGIYQLDNNQLSICVSADSRDRPKKMQRNDDFYWVLYNYSKTDIQANLPSNGFEDSFELEPGKFIPKGFFE